jgi:hypothetical protein
MYKNGDKMKIIVFLLTVIFMISPAFADDYIYTNKDLEKYKTPSHTILQPPDNPGNKNVQAKKVVPSRKKHRKEKPMQYVVPLKNNKKQSNCQSDLTVWPQNVQTQ